MYLYLNDIWKYIILSGLHGIVMHITSDYIMVTDSYLLHFKSQMEGKCVILVIFYNVSTYCHFNTKFEGSKIEYIIS